MATCPTLRTYAPKTVRQESHAPLSHQMAAQADVTLLPRPPPTDVPDQTQSNQAMPGPKPSVGVVGVSGGEWVCVRGVVSYFLPARHIQSSSARLHRLPAHAGTVPSLDDSAQCRHAKQRRPSTDGAWTTCKPEGRILRDARGLRLVCRCRMTPAPAWLMTVSTDPDSNLTNLAAVPQPTC